MAILSDYSLVNTRVNFTQHFSLPQTLRGGMSNYVQNCGRPDYLAGIGIFLKFKLRITA